MKTSTTTLLAAVLFTGNAFAWNAQQHTSLGWPPLYLVGQPHGLDMYHWRNLDLKVYEEHTYTSDGITMTGIRERRDSPQRVSWPIAFREEDNRNVRTTPINGATLDTSLQGHFMFLGSVGNSAELRLADGKAITLPQDGFISNTFGWYGKVRPRNYQHLLSEDFRNTMENEINHTVNSRIAEVGTAHVTYKSGKYRKDWDEKGYVRYSFEGWNVWTTPRNYVIRYHSVDIPPSGGSRRDNRNITQRHAGQSWPYSDLGGPDQFPYGGASYIIFQNNRTFMAFKVHPGGGSTTEGGPDYLIDGNWNSFHSGAFWTGAARPYVVYTTGRGGNLTNRISGSVTGPFVGGGGTYSQARLGQPLTHETSSNQIIHKGAHEIRSINRRNQYFPGPWEILFAPVADFALFVDNQGRLRGEVNGTRSQAQLRQQEIAFGELNYWHMIGILGKFTAPSSVWNPERTLSKTTRIYNFNAVFDQLGLPPAWRQSHSQEQPRM